MTNSMTRNYTDPLQRLVPSAASRARDGWYGCPSCGETTYGKFITHADSCGLIRPFQDSARKAVTR